jgi:hypothetical protein
MIMSTPDETKEGTAPTPNELELVAMIMSSLPVPPLPMHASKNVPEEITRGDTVCNSHDFMGMLLLKAMAKNDREGNKSRLAIQERINKTLFDDIDAIALDPTRVDPESAVYDAFTRFTAANLDAFITQIYKDDDDDDDGENSNNKRPLVEFAPMSVVMREDPVHVATCHHSAAQDILFGGIEGRDRQPAREFAECQYGALLMRQYARIRAARVQVAVQSVDVPLV